MTLSELLDQLGIDAPRCCQTCRHMGTHAKCDGCLGKSTTSVNAKGLTCYQFEYLNWEPGNWLRDLHAAEIAGVRNIVVGGQGEADFPATWSPEKVSKHLHHVAEQCGYVCGRLNRYGYEDERGRAASLDIITSEGNFRIRWNSADELVQIDVCDQEGYVVSCGWDRNDPDVRWDR